MFFLEMSTFQARVEKDAIFFSFDVIACAYTYICVFLYMHIFRFLMYIYVYVYINDESEKKNKICIFSFLAKVPASMFLFV